MLLPDSFALQPVAIVDDGRTVHPATVIIQHGKITYAGPQKAQDELVGVPVLDGSGWFATPGWIDLQVNGGYGYDFTEQPESIAVVAARLPETGVTAFLPTFITSPLRDYPQKLSEVRQAQGNAGASSRVLGAHLEGPFLSPASRGAHPASLFCDPSPDSWQYFDPIQAVRMVTLAAERNGGGEAVRWLRDHGVVVSIGHSAATAEQAQQAFAEGTRYVTHLYNAMPPLHHREPGLVGAALIEPAVRCGLIVDGIHCHPLMVNLAYRCKGPTGITLVTDAMAAMGMPPGQYSIGGQTVWLDETGARQAEGRLAGSILHMDQAVRNMISFCGCSLAEAVRMASATPAQVLEMDGQTGHLKTGYPADLVLLDETYHVQATLIGGQLAFSTAQAEQRLRFEDSLTG